MKRENSESSTDHALRVGAADLTVTDLIRYLSALAKMNDDGKTGNRQLSRALRTLIRVLNRHTGRSISDLAAILETEASSRSTKISKRSIQTELPFISETSSHDTIEQVLCEESLTKGQLIEVGYRRFGISKSKLSRIGRTQVIHMIRTALDHERSLRALRHEARRSGGIKGST